MYYQLTGAIKRRLIAELRDFWSNNPSYPDLPDNIIGKYSFKQRPHYGIIVKAGSGSNVQLSADNFIKTVQSYCFLTHVPGSRSTSLEWVREDVGAIQRNGGRFPTAPGVYYCEIADEKTFYIDPLLDVRSEIPAQATPTEYHIAQTPVSNSLRIYELPSNRILTLGTDYTVDSSGQVITLAQAVPKGLAIVADYRYAVPTTTWTYEKERALVAPIPGVVMAFGRRVSPGDKFAVVVLPNREDAYLEYGGRWGIAIDMDVIGMDVEDQEYITDATTIFLWGILRSRLADEGIEITEVSMGGESEEVADETGDDYFFNASLSLTVEADWRVFVPLAVSIKSMQPILTAVANPLGLVPIRDPYFSKFKQDIGD